MHQSTEQLASTARAQLDAQLQMATAIAESLLVGVEKFAGLNLQAARASFDASVGSAQHLLAAQNAQEFFSTATGQSQPQTDIALTYGRHLSSIAADAHRDLSRAAESQITTTSRQLVSLLDDIAKFAPAGSGSALSMMKSVIDNMSSGYAQLNKSTKVALDAIESNIHTTSSRIASQRA